MDRRTHEGFMDWEWQNGGATDPTSPFTQTVKNHQQNQQSVFATPSKLSQRPNPFASIHNSPLRPSSPNKSLPPLPSSAFAPSLPPASAASAFRNPAFTTPRKPFDEHVFSEQEDSPAGASDVPCDTPEADRNDDVVMGGVTPTKVDKRDRYARSLKKHTPGRGEIRSHRELAGGDAVRKRKRANLDRDVSSVARRVQQEWDDSEADSDTGGAVSNITLRRRQTSKQHQQHGIVGNAMHMMDAYPYTPDYIYRWIQLLVNCSMFAVFLYIGWSIVDTVRSDIRNANELARMELLGQMAECTEHYTVNECARKDRPALRAMCDQWSQCMGQDPEAIMRVKVTAKQMAEILNEFSETMNLKAWGFFFAILCLCAFANNLTFGRASATPPPPTAGPSSSSQPTMPASQDSAPPEAAPGYMWVQMQTPKIQRHALLADADTTDTDASPSPPKMKMLMPGTPSGRRSPTKMVRERERSPVKYGSPVRRY